MNIKGTYLIDEYFNFTIKIDYEYYYKAQTHEDPFEDQLDINYLDFDDYNKILQDTFKNYSDEIMEEIRGFFEAQIYNHAKALQKERVKEKEYYLKRGNTSGTID